MKKLLILLIVFTVSCSRIPDPKPGQYLVTLDPVGECVNYP